LGRIDEPTSRHPLRKEKEKERDFARAHLSRVIDVAHVDPKGVGS
jgi:hypothetical protein